MEKDKIEVAMKEKEAEAFLRNAHLQGMWHQQMAQYAYLQQINLFNQQQQQRTQHEQLSRSQLAAGAQKGGVHAPVMAAPILQIPQPLQPGRVVLEERGDAQVNNASASRDNAVAPNRKGKKLNARAMQESRKDVRKAMHTAASATNPQLETTAQNGQASLPASDSIKIRDAADIEALSDSLFQQLYNMEMSVPVLVNIMAKFKLMGPGSGVEYLIYKKMTSNIIEEQPHFCSYPGRELDLTAEFLGQMIKFDLLPAESLPKAVSCIMGALRERKHVKMLRFGQIALDQFRSRLSSVPEIGSIAQAEEEQNTRAPRTSKANTAAPGTNGYSTASSRMSMYTTMATPLWTRGEEEIRPQPATWAPLQQPARFTTACSVVHADPMAWASHAAVIDRAHALAKAMSHAHRVAPGAAGTPNGCTTAAKSGRRRQIAAKTFQNEAAADDQWACRNRRHRATATEEPYRYKQRRPQRYPDYVEVDMDSLVFELAPSDVLERLNPVSMHWSACRITEQCDDEEEVALRRLMAPLVDTGVAADSP